MNFADRVHHKFKRVEEFFSKRQQTQSYSRSVKGKLKLALLPGKNKLGFTEIGEILERILEQNIISFWYPQTIDRENGGYRLGRDLQGNGTKPKYKQLVPQTRILWFFSRLFNSQYGTDEYLKAAKHGYEFARDRLWDERFGGFYWEIDSSGEIATQPNKHLYGQAFALYALSEYAIASGDASALDLAKQLFSILEEYACDRQYGGYREYFQRDWSSAPPDETNYLGVPANVKQFNTHLHLMEAISTYYIATKDAIAQERLIELIFIHSNTVLQKTVGACTDRYQKNWTPITGYDVEYISYGHNLENIWLLMAACDLVGLSNHLFLDLYKTIFSYSIQYGFDYKQGGFYNAGYYNLPAYSRKKIWWVQAEALVAALRMYDLTQEEIYYHCFCQTLDWIVRHQVDWKNGEWHAEILPNGKPHGEKSGTWKAPYHNARALLECLNFIPVSLN